MKARIPNTNSPRTIQTPTEVSAVPELREELPEERDPLEDRLEEDRLEEEERLELPSMRPPDRCGSNSGSRARERRKTAVSTLERAGDRI